MPLRSYNVLLLVIAMCLGVVACAGYRGGWESLAYIGDTPPPAPPEDRTPFEAGNRAVLNVPGLRLRVTINNQLQTYDTQVYLYALPPVCRLCRSSAVAGVPRHLHRPVASTAGR